MENYCYNQIPNNQTRHIIRYKIIKIITIIKYDDIQLFI